MDIKVFRVFVPVCPHSNNIWPDLRQQNVNHIWPIKSETTKHSMSRRMNHGYRIHSTSCFPLSNTMYVKCIVDSWAGLTVTLEVEYSIMNKTAQCNSCLQNVIKSKTECSANRKSQANGSVSQQNADVWKRRCVVEIPFLTHWSYHSLALSPRCVLI